MLYGFRDYARNDRSSQYIDAPPHALVIPRVAKRSRGIQAPHGFPLKARGNDDFRGCRQRRSTHHSMTAAASRNMADGATALASGGQELMMPRLENRPFSA